MSRKTLKRITTNTNKKYVLGDVLGEGLCSLSVAPLELQQELDKYAGCLCMH